MGLQMGLFTSPLVPVMTRKLPACFSSASPELVDPVESETNTFSAGGEKDAARCFVILFLLSDG